MKKYYLLLPLFLIGSITFFGWSQLTSLNESSKDEPLQKGNLLSTQSHNNNYPVLFVHGHGAKNSIEDTWIYLIENKLNGKEGFSYYGKIWEKTELPLGLPKKSLFSFGYYRESANKSFGHEIGKIGGITKKLTDGDNNNYKNRISYALRLKNAVNSVLNATGATKVIIVAHSMGGLVARAYIKWLDGGDTVYKLLTVGTPNNGIPNDARLLMAQIADGQDPDWQDNGEYKEMSNASNFDGKAYTQWLNDGWKLHCQTKGVKYATLRGGYCPWPPPIDIGDGVVDELDAIIEGSVFNGYIDAAYGNSEYFPINNNFSKESSLISSTYTAEVIKRWLFRDEIHIGSNFKKRDPENSCYFMYLSPFKNDILYDYESCGNAIYGAFLVFNHLGVCEKVIGIPIFLGINQPILDTSDLVDGGYVVKLHVYDMEKNIFQETHLWGKSSFSGQDASRKPILSLNQYPDKITDNSNAVFVVQSDMNETYFSFKLNDGNWSDYSKINTIEFNNLSAERTHTLYISGTVTGGGFTENPLVYNWSISKEDEVIGGDLNTDRTVIADKKINANNVTIHSPAKVVFKAGNQIDITGNFDVERGASFDTVIE